MAVGEVIALLTKCSANEDDLLMAKGVCNIQVFKDSIEISFTDGNTADYRLYLDGRMEYL